VSNEPWKTISVPPTATVLVERPEHDDERAHRLQQAAINASWRRGIGALVIALAIAAGVLALVGPVDAKLFSSNICWTLLGSLAGYVLGTQAPR
jgi:hypothetical protein